MAPSRAPANAATDPRKLTEVAVGILLRADDQFLLATRPADKVLSGHWEFPGGKLEPGEDALGALRRELLEELGITVLQAQFWRETVHSYPHARVSLQFFLVTQWQGEPHPREGQTIAWQHCPPTVSPLLPGTLPVLEWFAQTPPSALRQRLL